MGYLTACLIVLLHTELVPLKRYRPRAGQIVLGLLALVNLLAGIVTLTAPRPNVGTLIVPLGLISYVGVVTIVASPLAILKKSQPAAKLFLTLSLLVLAVTLLITLLWICSAWLPAFVYYQPWLVPVFLIVMGTTAWFGLEWNRLSRLGRKHSLLQTLFFLTVAVEATAVYLVSNLLLLLFLGLVINP